MIHEREGGEKPSTRQESAGTDAWTAHTHAHSQIHGNKQPTGPSSQTMLANELKNNY